MFDHVKLGVSAYEAGKSFFLKALAPLSVYQGAESDGLWRRAVPGGQRGLAVPAPDCAEAGTLAPGRHERSPR